MSAVNPFDPPRAEVRDIPQHVTERSTPKVWSAKGRIGRLRYLAYTCVGSLVCFLVAAVAAFLAAAVGMGQTAVLGVLLVVAYVPLLLLCTLAMIQRAHDMGWSGWTCFLVLIPLVAFIWIFKSGTPGPNRFGAPPAPNTTGVKVGASLVLVFFLLGLVAAIALPAYQGYVMRAQGVQLQQ